MTEKELEDSLLRGYRSQDWLEDHEHENGNYFRVCVECGREFIGHKRRVICHICADELKEDNNEGL